MLKGSRQLARQPSLAPNRSIPDGRHAQPIPPTACIPMCARMAGFAPCPPALFHWRNGAEAAEQWAEVLFVVLPPANR